MEKYTLALKLLGLKSRDIVHILKEHQQDLVDMFNDHSEVLRSSLDLLRFQTIFDNHENVQNALEKAEEILDENIKEGIKTTIYGENTYPQILMNIENPPAAIFYRGAEFADVMKYPVASVGTREPTLLSYNAVNYITPQLVQDGCTIVSGLALGVDKLSHQSCITSGGKTVAVLAHGLDYIYPAANKELAHRILDTGGTLMSEYPIGIRPKNYTFIERDKLIIQMANAVVVYECKLSSGTMHSANFAIEQHKPIFCPYIGNTNADVQMGTKELINSGVASVVNKGRDVKNLKIAAGCETDTEYSTSLIMQNYVRSMLAVMKSGKVLGDACQRLGIPKIRLKDTEEIYNKLLEEVEGNSNITMKKIADTLAECNIEYLDKKNPK